MNRSVEEAKEAKADKIQKDFQANIEQLQDDSPRKEQKMVNAHAEA